MLHVKPPCLSENSVGIQSRCAHGEGSQQQTQTQHRYPDRPFATVVFPLHLR